jgi:Tol biopolymer transport system component
VGFRGCRDAIWDFPVKKPTFLESVRQQRAAQNENWSRGPLPEPVDLAHCADFDLGTWRVEVQQSRIVRGTRILDLDEQALRAVVLIARAGAEGIRRDILCLHLYGPVRPETHPEKLRRITSFLRRALGDDGSVRLLNTAQDGYAFETGAPIEGRERIDAYDHDAPMRVETRSVSAYLQRGRRRGLALGLAAAMVVGLGLVLIFLVERREGVLYGRIVKTSVLAHEPGRQLTPGFSPDGSQVVYAWLAPDGTEKLYRRPLIGGAAQALTDGPGRDENPVWSPKGNLIAFTRRGTDGCAVMVMAAAGGPARRLADCDFRTAGQLAWVRDGSALLISHRNAWEAPGQILLVSIADQKVGGVTSPATGMPGDSQPALATNGRRLGFVRTRAAGAEDLQVLDFDSGKPVRMTYDTAPINGMAWEQGGHSIVLASSRRGVDSLWRIRMDGAPPEWLVPSPDPLRRPVVTDDGRSLAFEHWHITSRFTRYGTSADGEPVEFRRGVAMERSLTLSSDGRLASYISNLGDRDAVYVASAPDGVPRPVTTGRYDRIETAALSPDGKHVAFAGVTQGRLDLYLIDLVTGTPETKIDGAGDNRAPSWSHDGRTLYYASTRNGKRWQLFRQVIGSSTAEQLTADGGLAAQESTDGQWLYFVRPDRKGLWQRSSAPGGDDRFLAGELSPMDWHNIVVAQDAVWFIGRPAGDPVVERYVFAKGRVEAGPVAAGLLTDSGITLLPSGKEVVVAEMVDAQVDIEVSSLE